MNVKKVIVTIVFIYSTINLWAQNTTASIVGKWRTEDNAIIEIYVCNNTYCMKQLSCTKEKDKAYNGQVIGKNIAANSSTEYKGIVIDPDNKKEYKAIFTTSANGKALNLKVKWGFINFNETWQKL